MHTCTHTSTVDYLSICPHTCPMPTIALRPQLPITHAPTPIGIPPPHRVNMFLVRSPWRSRHQEELYHKYKDEILFVGLSSFEDYPKPSVNPYSQKYPAGWREVISSDEWDCRRLRERDRQTHR